VRFLLLNQFYPPDDAPTGRLLHDLATVLVSRGHEVRVVCSSLGYDGTSRFARREIRDGVEIVRTTGITFRRASIVGRIVAYGAYLAGAVGAAFRGPAPDRVVSLTTPPFLGLAGLLVALHRRCRHAHWTMDIYPDALRAHWPAAGGVLAWAVLQWLGRLQFRRAALVVTLGSRVEERVRRYLPPGTALKSIPLWATETHDSDPEPRASERALHGWQPDELVFMYSGNMGLGHRFSDFLEAARRLSSQGPRWAFFGDGPRRREIEDFRAAHPSARVEISPYVDRPRLARSLAAADVQLVSVAPGWEGIMVPSKLQNVFAVGRPVIFLGAEDTEVAAWIRESGGGWVVAPEDVDGLLGVVKQAHDPAERERRGAAAVAYARLHFDRQKNCAEMAALLERG
jgi:glycosyltransferase involved in cell wall biosynthesis